MSRPQLTNNAKYTILPATSHSALAMSNWSLDLFPHSPEPSFLLRPLDRYETSLLLLSAVIPRNVVNLWIAMGLVSRTPLPTGSKWIMSRDRPRNMQESEELRLAPLFLVVPSRGGGCLKNRRCDEYVRHLYPLWQKTETCSQGYPQKVGNENSHATRIARERFRSTLLKY